MDPNIGDARSIDPDIYTCSGCRQPASRRARRCGRCERITQAELDAMPFGAHLLEGDERAEFELIHQAVYRHAFYDHDCQTTDCSAMHLWRSSEMRALLDTAYELGRASANGSDEQEGTVGPQTPEQSGE